MEDLVTLQFLSTDDFNFGNDTEAYELRNEAYNILVEKLIKNTDKNVNNRTPASRRNLELYEYITPNIKMHKETGELYLVGMVIRKTVVEPIERKPKNSKPLTRAKDTITRIYKSGKIRQFFLSKITSIKINGNELIIE